MRTTKLVFIQNFCRFWFRGRLTSATSERGKGVFSKVTFLKSYSSKKDELRPGFEVKFFTKSLHRGGVISTPISLTLFQQGGRLLSVNPPPPSPIQKATYTQTRFTKVWQVPQEHLSNVPFYVWFRGVLTLVPQKSALSWSCPKFCNSRQCFWTYQGPAPEYKG